MSERSIFTEALECATASERSTYLDTACAGDAALRGRVEALLKSHESAGGFLGKLGPQRVAEALSAERTAAETEDVTAAVDTSDATLEFLEPPTSSDALGRLGHYEILEVIGRGGMGIVLRAFDEKLQRVVAIKVMAPGI